jgi:hypothetical protein
LERFFREVLRAARPGLGSAVFAPRRELVPTPPRLAVAGWAPTDRAGSLAPSASARGGSGRGLARAWGSVSAGPSFVCGTLRSAAGDRRRFGGFGQRLVSSISSAVCQVLRYSMYGGHPVCPASGTSVLDVKLVTVYSASGASVLDVRSASVYSASGARCSMCGRQPVCSASGASVLDVWWATRLLCVRCFGARCVVGNPSALRQVLRCSMCSWQQVRSVGDGFGCGLWTVRCALASRRCSS